MRVELFVFKVQNKNRKIKEEEDVRRLYIIYKLKCCRVQWLTICTMNIDDLKYY